MSFTDSWDNNDPPGTQKSKTIAAELNQLRRQVSERLSQILGGGLTTLAGVDPLIDGTTRKNLVALTTQQANQVTTPIDLVTDVPVVASGAHTIGNYRGFPTGILSQNLATTAAYDVPMRYGINALHGTGGSAITATLTLDVSSAPLDALVIVKIRTNATWAINISWAGNWVFNGTTPASVPGHKISIFQFYYSAADAKAFEICRSVNMTW